MFARFLFALLTIAGFSNACLAAGIDKITLKCINKQEAPADDIYLEVYADGTLVDGFGRENIKELSNGDIWVIDKKIMFTTNLKIRVREKDKMQDDTFGEVTITASGSGKTTLGGGQVAKYEYTLSWE
jgi:hypothetical protein